jgi:hypothetical protein
MKRNELKIAVYQENDEEDYVSGWLPGRITYISKEHLYVKLEEYSIQERNRTDYIEVENEFGEDDDEFIYLDDLWIPETEHPLKKICSFPSENVCKKLSWSDFNKTWKIPLSNLNPSKISTPWYSGTDMFAKDLDYYINKNMDSKKILDQSKVIMAGKIQTCAEERFNNKLTEWQSEENFDTQDYKLRDDKEFNHENFIGCSPFKYYIPSVKLNDALIWNNHDTIHRSPFVKSQKVLIRSFLNIRFLRKDENRPHPYYSKNMDMSQLI